MNNTPKVRIEAKISRLIEGKWIPDFIGFDSMNEMCEHLEDGIINRTIILHEFTEHKL